MTRRDSLFGFLIGLGGLPLIAKEIAAPEKLVLDPGDVIRWDSLALAFDKKLQDTFRSIPVTHEALSKINLHGPKLEKVSGFAMCVDRRSNFVRLILDVDKETTK